jgi:Methyltransferase domain
VQHVASIDPRSLPVRSQPTPTNWKADVGNRRYPRRSQWDYHLLRILLVDLERVLPTLVPPGGMVLDVYCGAKPYVDLLPPGSRCIGLDVKDTFGMADVVTTEFLPFTDAAFDGVMSTQAFYYTPDPEHAVSELRRVLRPGGRLVLTVHFVYPYARDTIEHRWTEANLRRLFEGWDDVEVKEQGGRGVTWAVVTGLILSSGVQRAAKAVPPLAAPLSGAASLAYRACNAIAAGVDAADARSRVSGERLPANLMLTARRPAD